MTDQFAVLVLAVCFLLGVRSTWHLRAIHKAESAPRNLITGAFYFVSLTVTIAAGFFGFLSARRVLGLDPIPGIGPVSILVAAAVLLIPVFLDWTVSRVRLGTSQLDRVEAQGDRIEASLAENTTISQGARDDAHEAAEVANSMNKKIAAQGERITAAGELAERRHADDAT